MPNDIPVNPMAPHDLEMGRRKVSVEAFLLAFAALLILAQSSRSTSLRHWTMPWLSEILNLAFISTNLALVLALFPIAHPPALLPPMPRHRPIACPTSVSSLINNLILAQLLHALLPSDRRQHPVSTGSQTGKLAAS